MQKQDRWHFSRRLLAEQILGMFDTGLSNALTFFAPRRMGKTEFLRKDILPFAKQKDWLVLYFSFLDVGEQLGEAFMASLQAFLQEKSQMAKVGGVLKRIRKVGGAAFGIKAGVEFDAVTPAVDVKSMLSTLAQLGNVLLLLDEVQVLALNPKNQQFVAALRTALDMHKDQVKVIFTGSSQEGLRQMFSKASAPFFHFGQNLPFPEFGEDFIHHLAAVFQEVTQRPLDVPALWQAFVAMDKIPQLIRALVERLALHPDQSIDDVRVQLMDDVFNDRSFVEIFASCSLLSQQLLRFIAAGKGSLYSENSRSILAERMGGKLISVSMVQSALRALQARQLIAHTDERGQFVLEDPHFRRWLLQT